MPFSALKAMRLAAGAPISCSAAVPVRLMPCPPLPSAARAVASVPMKLLLISLSLASMIVMPFVALPLMRLPSPRVPPM